MHDGGENIIIVKKHKGGHGVHHGGAWKVAYADFVTAMMALFIVLWVLGQDEKVIQSVAGYFKDPIGFSTQGKNILPGQGQGPKFNIIDEQQEQIERANEVERLEAMKQQIVDELSKNPDLGNLLDQLKIEMVEEGLRIEMMESKEDIFFEIGTAQLKPEAQKLLLLIGKQVETLQNKVIIEGHTDSRPFLAQNSYTNFELSADRANSARKILVKGGLSENKIKEIRGYADSRLLNKDDPYNVVNRRISIILKFMDKK
ncbi:MAG: flagellar motor protein MotB [Ignavibacteria bacterium]|nr:flagellar motor protein MotB [Ignavibacteria bacterium]